LPFFRAAADLELEIACPPFLPNSAIQDFVPKIPATSSGIPKSTSKLSQCTLLPEGGSQTSASCSGEAPSKPCASFGGKQKIAPFLSLIVIKSSD
jgi:hypothetical protein